MKKVLQQRLKGFGGCDGVRRSVLECRALQGDGVFCSFLSVLERCMGESTV